MTKPIHTAEGAYSASSTGSSATITVWAAVEPSVPAVRPYSLIARSRSPRVVPSRSGSFALGCSGPRKARQGAGPLMEIQAPGAPAGRPGVRRRGDGPRLRAPDSRGDGASGPGPAWGGVAAARDAPARAAGAPPPSGAGSRARGRGIRYS